MRISEAVTSELASLKDAKSHILARKPITFAEHLPDRLKATFGSPTSLVGRESGEASSTDFFGMWGLQGVEKLRAGGSLL